MPYTITNLKIAFPHNIHPSFVITSSGAKQCFKWKKRDWKT